MRKLSFILFTIIFIGVNVEAQISIIDVKLVRVYDGDTFFVKFPNDDLLHKIFGNDDEIGIRIKDINAYGITKREKDEKKRAEGIKAKDKLFKLLQKGNITLHDVEIGVYGRLFAHVRVNDEDVGEYMLKKGYAEVYSATKKDNVDKIANVELVRVVDGDTFFVKITNDDLSLHKLFGNDDEVGIRIKGIDTCEMDDADKKKVLMAEKAGDELDKLLRSGSITLHNVEVGVFARLVADVKVDGKDVGKYMLKKGYAKVYKK